MAAIIGISAASFYCLQFIDYKDMLLVLIIAISYIQDVSSTCEHLMSLHNKLLNTSNNLEQNVLCYNYSNISDIIVVASNSSSNQTNIFSLLRSNLTLDDAVKAFMDLLTNTDDDQMRKKRQTFNCFDLIEKVNLLQNVLNRTEIIDYELELEDDIVEILSDIYTVADNVGCGCDEREKKFVSYQLDLLEFHLQAISDFINETLNDGLENASEVYNKMSSIQEAVNNKKESSTEAFKINTNETSEDLTFDSMIAFLWVSGITIIFFTVVIIDLILVTMCVWGKKQQK